MSSGLDLRELAGRAARCVGGRIDRLTRLTGGTSGLTYSGEWQPVGGAARQVVVKVAPPGLEPVRNRDVLRQARILRGLADSAVSVPAVLGEDPGAPLDVPPLFVMEFVSGESYEPMQRDDQGRSSASAEDIGARALSAMRMLAAMHELTPDALGLGPEPVYSPADELARWHRAFATTEGDLHPPVVDDAYQLLAEGPPDPLPPVVVHGDWRLGNMQCAGPRVEAVIDWEIWSLGDPRLDLSWFLLMTDPHRRGSVPHAGIPERDVLIAGYAQPDALPDLAWFAALVRYKQAAASALICKNTRRCENPDARRLAMVDLVPSLAGRAVEILNDRRIGGADGWT